jgi:hypothetical protein
MSKLIAMAAIAIWAAGCVTVPRDDPDRRRYVCTTHDNLTECSERSEPSRSDGVLSGGYTSELR